MPINLSSEELQEELRQYAETYTALRKELSDAEAREALAEVYPVQAAPIASDRALQVHRTTLARQRRVQRTRWALALFITAGLLSLLYGLHRLVA